MKGRGGEKVIGMWLRLITPSPFHLFIVPAHQAARCIYGVVAESVLAVCLRASIQPLGAALSLRMRSRSESLRDLQVRVRVWCCESIRNLCDQLSQTILHQ